MARTIDDATSEELEFAMNWVFDNKLRSECTSTKWDDLEEGDKSEDFHRLFLADGRFYVQLGYETVSAASETGSRFISTNDTEIIDIGTMEDLKASEYWEDVKRHYKDAYRDLSCRDDIRIDNERNELYAEFPIYPHERDWLGNTRLSKSRKDITIICGYMDEDGIELTLHDEVLGNRMLSGLFREVQEKLELLDAVERAGIKLNEGNLVIPLPESEVAQ